MTVVAAAPRIVTYRRRRRRIVSAGSQLHARGNPLTSVCRIYRRTIVRGMRKYVTFPARPTPPTYSLGFQSRIVCASKHPHIASVGMAFGKVFLISNGAHLP